MPKSKRSRLYALTNAKRKGTEGKSALVREVQDCFDRFSELFVFSVDNMRNNKLKDLRSEWRHSRFFFGKRRVLQMALGRSPVEEHKEGLHRVSEHLQGSAGLLLTNQPCDQVLRWFSDFAERDFARAGFVSAEEVTLTAGPLLQFPHNLEPQLRALGVPTALEKGTVVLTEDHCLCRPGDILSPEQARIIKLFGIKLAEFKINLKCHWNQSGKFRTFDD